jgi:hypothetical protein
VLGGHLHHWTPKHTIIRPIDYAAVTIIPSGTASVLLVRASDHRAILTVSDFDQSAVIELVKTLKKENIRAIVAIVVTSVKPNTAAGIVSLIGQIPITGPIVTPYQASDSARWNWSIQNFSDELSSHNLTLSSWATKQSAWTSCLPNTTVVVFTYPRSPWEAPDTAVRIQYGDGSLLDLSSLTPGQVQTITDQPIPACQILVINGQNEYASKELLSWLQPAFVVLTGTEEAPPGDRVEMNVMAADAKPVDLYDSSPTLLSLPSSNFDAVEMVTHF